MYAVHNSTGSCIDGRTAMTFRRHTLSQPAAAAAADAASVTPVARFLPLIKTDHRNRAQTAGGWQAGNFGGGLRQLPGTGAFVIRSPFARASSSSAAADAAG